MPGTHPHVAQIAEGPTGPDVAAFFDLDGTIVDGYTVSAFYEQRLRDRELTPMELLQFVAAAAESELDEQRFTALAGRAAAMWTGRDEADLHELGRRLLVQKIGGTVFPDAWEVVQAHRRVGHTIVMASAASRFQVQPIAAELGADAVLCTEFETVDGMLTGRLDGPPVWGGRKAEAVRDHAEAHGLDLSRCWAYGNGDEDIEFLATVGRPHAVNPAPRLREHALERGWPIVEFEGRGRAGPVRLARSAAMYAGLLTAASVGVGASILNRDRQQGVDLASGLMGDVALAIAGVHVRVQGAEHLWSHRPAVFVFNHQSGIDMPVMMKLVRERFTGVAKAELARTPAFGPLFRWADVAFVDRSDTARAKQALQPVVDKLRDGISIIIAPEGTRSATPRLGPFKKGAFHLAMQAQVPMVPVVIRNAGEVAWRSSLVVRPGTVDVFVHPPVATDGWTVERVGEHVDEVRQLFVDTLADWPDRAGVDR